MRDQIRDILKKTWPEWEIDEIIGGGAFGTVFGAVRSDMAGTTRAAIKVVTIPRDDEDLEAIRAEGYTRDETYAYFQKVVQDYTSEIKLLDSVKGYTNIIGIDDYKIVESGDEVCWVILIRMELLNKVDFRAMGEKEIIRLGIDMCEALEICRKKNIVHRDIKPENILVNDIGNYKLGDFGVARMMETTRGNISVKGTPNYMAPEVYKAMLKETDIDAAARADIYSLGLVLYWISNGSRLPFMPAKQIPSPADRETAFTRRIGGEQLPAPEKVSEGLQQVILKACAYDPDDRYQTAEEMGEALRALTRKSPEPAGNAGKETGKPEKKSRKWLAAAAALLLIGGGIAIFLANRPAKPPEKGENPPAVQADVTPEVRTEKAELYHITLIASNIRVGDFEKVKKTVKGRLDIFTEGKGYQWVENGDTIDVYLPAELFAGKDVDEILRTHISRAIKLYLADYRDTSRMIPVSRGDLESVALVPADALPAGAAAEQEEGASRQYIAVTFTDDFVSRNRETYESWEVPVLAQDIAESPDLWYGYGPDASEDGKVLYFLADPETKYADLVLYNYQHDSLPESLRYQVDLNYQVQWEIPGEYGHLTYGERQCAPDDFTEGTVTFCLRRSEQMNEGNWLNMRTALLARMDSLGLPYAIGRKSGLPGEMIAVRTLPDHINDEVLDLLGENISFRIISRDYQMSILPGAFERRSDGQFTIDINGWDAGTYNGLAETAGNEDEPLYATMNGFPVLMMDPERIPETGGTIGAELCAIQNGRVVRMETEPENSWYGDFLEALIRTREYIDSGLSYDYRQFNPAEDGSIPGRDDLAPALFTDAEEIRQAVRTVLPGAEVDYGIDDAGVLSVVFYLPADAEFPARSLELIRQVFEAADWNRYYIDRFRFAVGDEDDPDQGVLATIFRENRILLTGAAAGEKGETREREVYCTMGQPTEGMRDYARTLGKLLEEADFYKPETAGGGGE